MTWQNEALLLETCVIANKVVALTKTGHKVFALAKGNFDLKTRKGDGIPRG